MANKTIPMQKVRDIIQLYVSGYSYRKISKITGVHRTVITNYITHLSKSLPLEVALSLPEQAFNDLFKNEAERVPLNQKQLWLNDFLVYAEQEIKKKHVTRQLLYQEYQEKYTATADRQVFSYSIFVSYCIKGFIRMNIRCFRSFFPGRL